MCGIAGIVSAPGDEGFRLALGRMMRIQQHRGPDGEGTWSGSVACFQVGLAHNRLAILDLSEAGHQPMFLPDGSQALIYNGEIYNYKELRSDLEAEGIRFRSQRDALFQIAGQSRSHQRGCCIQQHNVAPRPWDAREHVVQKRCVCLNVAACE